MIELQGLLLTVAIEGPVAFLVSYVSGWRSRGDFHVALAAMVATAVTHPQLWQAVIWAHGRLPYWPSTLAFEGCVVLVEAVLIAWMAQLRADRALAVSLACNLASLLIGLAVFG